MSRVPAADADPLPISALQHWAYCPRQCALIHLEQAFDDNVHTLRGQALHQRADDSGHNAVKGVRVVRALPLWHDALGLIGKADIVEFAPTGACYPVEYKLGNRSKSPAIAACDALQVAAQAMCLEHMTGRPVGEGAIFYAGSRRRQIVPVTSGLREQVEETIEKVRRMLDSRVLPPALLGEARRRCRHCSLQDRCMPQAQANDALAFERAHLFDTEP